MESQIEEISVHSPVTKDIYETNEYTKKALESIYVHMARLMKRDPDSCYYVYPAEVLNNGSYNKVSLRYKRVEK